MCYDKCRFFDGQSGCQKGPLDRCPENADEVEDDNSYLYPLDSNYFGDAGAGSFVENNQASDRVVLGQLGREHA